MFYMEVKIQLFVRTYVQYYLCLLYNLLTNENNLKKLHTHIYFNWTVYLAPLSGHLLQV